MRISELAFEQIKEFEGVRLTAYKCPAGVWTIGYGHTKGVRAGQTISLAQAESLLRGDILPCEQYVRGLGLTLTQGQFDALVDFAFNLGIGALESSTLLEKIRADADEQEVRRQFARWVYAGGVRLKGLERRRTWEANRYYDVE